MMRGEGFRHEEVVGFCSALFSKGYNGGVDRAARSGCSGQSAREGAEFVFEQHVVDGVVLCEATGTFGSARRAGGIKRSEVEVEVTCD